MKEYDGAVLFVDILGISALTTSSVSIVEERDFKALSPVAVRLNSALLAVIPERQGVEAFYGIEYCLVQWSALHNLIGKAFHNLLDSAMDTLGIIRSFLPKSSGKLRLRSAGASVKLAQLFCFHLAAHKFGYLQRSC